MTPNEPWPALVYSEWKPTCDALHLWAQIAGKYRLAHTPWVNHSWHATLYPTPHGLTTGPVPDGDQSIALTFDFRRHRFVAVAAGVGEESFPLEPMSVASFLARTTEAIRAVGGNPSMHGAPNELPDPVPFAQDTAERPYDAQAAERFHRALVSIDRVFSRFRTGFVGKVSPVHLFWGAFDLAVTRFSGRRAPRHPGGIPHLPDDVTREAYSHEVSSAGFWPGGSGADEAMFYSYAYPAPESFASATVQPDEARYDESLGEFVLSYEAVRQSSDPEQTLMRFLRSTYDAAADGGEWDREALECALGEPRVPRALD